VSDDTGRSIGFRVSNRDITDRKQAEEKILSEQDKILTAIEGSVDIIGITDLEGNIKTVNKSFTRITGFERKEVIGKNLTKVQPKKDVPKALNGFKEVLEKGVCSTFELDFLSKDGRTINTLASGVLLRDEQGKPSEGFLIAKDITEQKEIQKRLEESERKYRELVEDIRDAIYFVDAKGKVVYISPAVKSIVGYEPHELIGKHFSDFVHSEDLKIMKKGFESALGGKSTPADYRIVNKAGSYTWIRALSNVVKDDNNNILGIRGAISDITERKKVEEELSKNEEQLSQIYDSTSDVLFYIEVEPGDCFRFVSINQSFLKATGFTREQIIGKRIEEVIPEPSVWMVLDNYKKAIKENRIVRWEETSDYPVGTKIGEVSIAPVWDEKGICTNLVGSVHDITEPKSMEEELAKNEERFRRLMEESPLDIVILNPEGKITEVNNAWMQNWGVDEEETAKVMACYNQRTDTQFKDLGFAPLVERAYAGESVILPPIHYIPKREFDEMGLEGIDARSRWIQIHLYSVKDENGDIVYVVNINMDITELKQAEEEAHRQREALARVDRATRMGQLTGSISHELNQPLTGILSNAQAAELMIKKGLRDPNELEEIMTDIIADAKRAGDVIRHLRELYREQKGEYKPVDINAIVKETTRLLRSEFVTQHVVLTTEYMPSIHKVKGNRIQIEQVLVNLIMNGIQAMSGKARNDRRLQIATSYNANKIKVWVEDSGTGVDADKIDHIFEPLATWKSGGIGLGLAVSNSIIEAHGGKMWAENRPEGGSRVGFALPAIKESKKA